MISKTGNKSFTLIEIMVTTVILSLGIVLLFRPFFNLLDASIYCSDYLLIQPVIDEKLWEASDDLALRGKLTNIAPQGTFTNANKIFTWGLAQEAIGSSNNFNLYRIDLTCSWSVGARSVSVRRLAYALQKKP